MVLEFIALVVLAAGMEPAGDVGPLVRALWMIQQYGTADCVDPTNDARVKGTLAKALTNDGVLTLSELDGFITPDALRKLAGADGLLQREEIMQAVDLAVPESRKHLDPRVRQHADFLTTSFDQIDPAHRLASAKLADWIAKNYRAGAKLDIINVCTANSRRSMIGSTMGNIAAAYYGMPEIRWHTGGTAAPTAFNPRAIKTLMAIGVEIEPTGKEAPRGEQDTKNPIYLVRWGTASETGIFGPETTEFSKKYGDPANPSHGFAALVVCGEADESCPVVQGASVWISAPFNDPKIFDGSSYESAKYAERRDDMGRFMLSVMLQARARLAPAASVAQQPGGRR
jgi:hypothetical protein